MYLKQRFPWYFLLWIFLLLWHIPLFFLVLGEWLRAEELHEGNNQQWNRNPHCVGTAGSDSTFCSGSWAARGIIRVRAQSARGAEEGITLRKLQSLQQDRNKGRNVLFWCCFVTISSENPTGIPMLSPDPFFFFFSLVRFCFQKCKTLNNHHLTPSAANLNLWFLKDKK